MGPLQLKKLLRAWSLDVQPKQSAGGGGPTSSAPGLMSLAAAEVVSTESIDHPIHVTYFGFRSLTFDLLTFFPKSEEFDRESKKDVS